MGTLTLTPEPASSFDQSEERLRLAESAAWLNLLEDLAGPSTLSLTRGLAASGVLLDLTLGGDAIEVWTACSTPGFLVRHQVTLGNASAERLHKEKATRDLALADALYPEWLSRMRESSTEARQNPVLLQS